MLPNANHPAPSARRLGSFQGTNSASASDEDDALARHAPTPPMARRRLEDDAVVRATEVRDVKELFAVGTTVTPDEDDVTPPRRVVEEDDAVVRACFVVVAVVAVVVVLVFIIVVAIIILTSFPGVVRVSTACVVASLCYDERGGGPARVG